MNANKLWTWLQTWGLNGITLHPIHGVLNFGWVKPNPSYSLLPLANAYSRYFEVSGDPLWKDQVKAIERHILGLADRNHMMRNTSFEYNPGIGGVIHTANTVLALMKCYEVTRDKRSLLQSKRTIESLIKLNWNGRGYTGTFNQDLTLSAALKQYSLLTGNDTLFRLYGRGVVRSAFIDSRVGCTPHAMSGSQRDKFIPWYQSVVAWALFECGEEDLARKNLQYCYDHLDHTGLTHSQYFEDGRLRTVNTKVVAPAFYSLKVGAENGIAAPHYVLKGSQLKTGGIRNSAGLGIRDYMASTPWSAFALEHHAQTANSPPKTLKMKTGEYTEGDYAYRESHNIAELKFKNSLIWRVEKKTGKIKKFPLEKKHITGKIRPKLAGVHICRIHQGIRAHTFGYVDPNMNYNLEDGPGDVVLWAPGMFVHAEEHGTDISATARNQFYTDYGSMYMAMRGVFFHTPIFNSAARLSSMMAQPFSHYEQRKARWF